MATSFDCTSVVEDLETMTETDGMIAATVETQSLELSSQIKVAVSSTCN